MGHFVESLDSGRRGSLEGFRDEGWVYTWKRAMSRDQTG